MTTEERFWSKVDASGDCWEWMGYRRPNGYGGYSVYVPPGRIKKHPAHRFAYETLVGPVPSGLDLDHLCRNPPCVNPDHLEPVTRRENLRRSPIHPSGKTHCSRGHPLDEGNTYWYAWNGQPRRRCRTCYRPAGAAAKERWRAKKRAAVRLLAGGEST